MTWLRSLDRSAEVTVQRVLDSDTALARGITWVVLALVAVGVAFGAAVLARGPVCEALDKAAGGIYCEAKQPPRVTPAT